MYLHSGYLEQEMNSPKRPSRRRRLRPQSGHFSSSGVSGFFCTESRRRVVLHSGYPVQAMKVPKRPRLRTMGLPQFSQNSSSLLEEISASPRSVRLIGFSLVKLQEAGSFLSKVEQTKKEPCLPHLRTRGEPQRSHFWSVAFSMR